MGIPHRETNLVLLLMEESQIKSKTVMGWNWGKKKEGIFCTVYFLRRKLFLHLCFISLYSVINTISEHTYFYISKNIFSYTFVACFVFYFFSALYHHIKEIQYKRCCLNCLINWYIWSLQKIRKPNHSHIKSDIDVNLSTSESLEAMFNMLLK